MPLEHILPDDLFYPIAYANLVVASIGVGIGAVCLHRMHLAWREDEVRRVLWTLVCCILLDLILVGVFQMSLILFLPPQLSIGGQHKLCWFLGGLNYIFLVNVHVWACAMGSRILAGLVHRCTERLEVRQLALRIHHGLSARNTLITWLTLGVIQCIAVLILNDEMSPHHIQVTAGGCWSSARAANYVIVVPVVLFVIYESVIFVCTFTYVRWNDPRLPHSVSAFFRRLLIFTGLLLVSDWLLCMFIVVKHLFDLLAANNDAATAVLNLFYTSVYTTSILLTFLVLLPARILTAGAMDSVFVNFHKTQMDGNGELWRAMQEVLIRDRSAEFQKRVCPLVQSWTEDNAPELPFRFIANCVSHFRDASSSEEVNMMSLIEDEEAFDEMMHGMHQEFVLAEQTVHTPLRERRATGFVFGAQPDEEDEDEEDEGADVDEAEEDSGVILSDTSCCNN